VRHTFAADIVPAEDVPNAVALNSTMFNAGKVLGPAVAGVAISLAGVAATFAFNVLSYAVMGAALMCITPSEVHPRVATPREAGAVRAGFRYARRTPVIFAVLSLTTVTGLIAYEWNTLVPLLAQVFSPDSAMIGYFFAAMGAGAIVGSLTLAGVLVASARTVFVSALVLAVMLGFVAAAPSLTFALVALFLLGAAATVFRAMATALIQLVSDPSMRGRVVSLLIMALNGTSPVSGPLVGAIAEHVGAGTAAGLGAAVTATAAAAAWRYLKAAAPHELRV
jgi:predicted MFS family arabinose efflux permease